MLYGLDKLCPRLNGKIAAVAHRGDSAHFQENTWSAVEAAIKDGVDIIEIDVQMSDDGDLYCYHDKTLEGIQFDYLASEILDRWGVPRLNSVLEAARDLDNSIAIVLDCKKQNWSRVEFFSDAAAYAMRIHKRVAVYCNSVAVLRELREDIPDAILLKGTLSAHVVGEYENLVQGYMVGSAGVVEEAILRAHAKDKFVLAHRFGLDKKFPLWSEFLNYCIAVKADGALCGDTSVFSRA